MPDLSDETTVSRRRFLKFSAAGAVVAVVAGIGGYISYLSSRSQSSPSQNPPAASVSIPPVAFPAPPSQQSPINPNLGSQNATVPESAKTVIGVRGEKLMVTDGTKHLVPLEKILSGGPPPDGIPPIESPKFVTPQEADKWLRDDEFVLGISLDGVARAYPYQILVWHEIVNETINNRPVLITYCPLCKTSIAFERMVNGAIDTFGTSGKLYNSDLVMYDRKTRSYWSQITGQAIVGPLTGTVLKRIPVDTVTWGEWKTLHSDTQVLSRDTGHRRSYGSDPYGSYYTTGGPFFPVDHEDNRLEPKAVVYGIFLEGKAKAYPDAELAKANLVNDVFQNQHMLIVRTTSGLVRFFDRTVESETLEFQLLEGKIRDNKSSSEWDIDGLAISGQLKGKRLTQIPVTPEFWFAWVAFYPDTTLYKTA